MKSGKISDNYNDEVIKKRYTLSRQFCKNNQPWGH